MTTDQEQAASEADDSSEQNGSPAQTVRVPNVTPGAKSGLDHTVIGADALDPDDDDPDDEPDLMVPAGDMESRLSWVADAETQDEAQDRANALWQHEKAADADEASLATLAAALRVAVYGSAPDRGASIPGELVESETAGTGDATNAETGVTTPGGEPLPTIEQDSGTPLAPPADTDQQDGDGSGDADQS